MSQNNVHDGDESIHQTGGNQQQEETLQMFANVQDNYNKMMRGEKVEFQDSVQEREQEQKPKEPVVPMYKRRNIQQANSTEISHKPFIYKKQPLPSEEQPVQPSEPEVVKKVDTRPAAYASKKQQPKQAFSDPLDPSKGGIDFRKEEESEEEPDKPDASEMLSNLISREAKEEKHKTIAIQPQLPPQKKFLPAALRKATVQLPQTIAQPELLVKDPKSPSQQSENDVPQFSSIAPPIIEVPKAPVNALSFLAAQYQASDSSSDSEQSEEVAKLPMPVLKETTIQVDQSKKWGRKPTAAIIPPPAENKEDKMKQEVLDFLNELN